MNEGHIFHFVGLYTELSKGIVLCGMSVDGHAKGMGEYVTICMDCL